MSGALLLFYHAEQWPGGNFSRFYSLIGLALSTDGGVSWTDVGEIVSPALPYGASARPFDVGGGPFLLRDGFFYVYFRELRRDGNVNNLAVARAAIADVVDAALERRLVPLSGT